MNKYKSIKCSSCKKIYQEKIDFCAICKFPFNGTEQEKSIHIGQFILKKGVIFDSSHNITKSQNLLYGIASLNILYLFMSNYLGDSIHFHEIIINIIISIILLFFAYNLDRNPWFILISLAVILILYYINYLIEPESLYQDIKLKLAIIGSLIYSYFLQKNADKFIRKHKL